MGSYIMMRNFGSTVTKLYPGKELPIHSSMHND
jgi:hypothetical protein